MADADARGNVLKSLGVTRRRGADGEAASPEADAATASEGPAAPAAVAGLGIKRRKPTPDAQGEDAAPKDAGGGSGGGTGLGIKRRSKGGDEAAKDAGEDSGGGSGLGIKRRSKPDAAAQAGDDAAAPEGPPDPLAKVRGKLGNDECAVLLLNFFRVRPDLVETLPERLWELERTHGRYMGDGRPERNIHIGWRPSYVLFTLPAYPDGPPTFTKDWTFIQPGPNRQPKLTDEGFVVDAPYNLIGDWFFYIVFQDDGRPVVEATADEATAAERPKKATTGLGIKRRK